MTIEESAPHLINKAVAWAAGQDTIRVLIWTSSRTTPQAPVDRFSDYDLIIATTDVSHFTSDETWVEWYGTPLVRFRDQDASQEFPWWGDLVLYEDGAKIDYTLWPMATLQKIARAPRLSEELDVGYRVLLDKDHLTHGLAAPTYRAHIPPQPTPTEFLALVEEFWWETIYVAKNLWRGELFPAKYSFDAVCKLDLLRRMLEWVIEADHDWSIRPGAMGRHLSARLPAALWQEVESTFVGADLEENWEALFRLTALFRTSAETVATSLGYIYPRAVDDRVTQYLLRARGAPR